MEKIALDSGDIRILKVLQDDASLSIAEVAKLSWHVPNPLLASDQEA